MLAPRRKQSCATANSCSGRGLPSPSSCSPSTPRARRTRRPIRRFPRRWSPTCRPTRSLREGEAAPQHLSDLTITNFFSEGWNQSWAKRQRYTPDMALLQGDDELPRARVPLRLRPHQRRQQRDARLDGHDQRPDRLRPEPPADDRGRRQLPVEQSVRRRYEERSRRRLPVAIPARRHGHRFVRLPGPHLAGEQGDRPDPDVAAVRDGRLAGHARRRRRRSAGSACTTPSSTRTFSGSHAVGAMQNDISYDVSFAETWTQPTTPFVRQLHDVRRVLRTDRPGRRHARARPTSRSRRASGSGSSRRTRSASAWICRSAARRRSTASCAPRTS